MNPQALLLWFHFIPLLIPKEVWLFPEVSASTQPSQMGCMFSFLHLSYHSLDLEVEMCPPFSTLSLRRHFSSLFLQKPQPNWRVDHQSMPIATPLYGVLHQTLSTPLCSFIGTVTRDSLFLLPFLLWFQYPLQDIANTLVPPSLDITSNNLLFPIIPAQSHTPMVIL